MGYRMIYFSKTKLKKRVRIVREYPWMVNALRTMLPAYLDAMVRRSLLR